MAPSVSPGCPSGRLIRLFSAIAFLLLSRPLLASDPFTGYDIPSGESRPWDICVGSDGALWFNEPYVEKIGRITTDGVITEFTTGTGVNGLATGPDGNVWFTQNDAIGRITPAGVITFFPATAPAGQPEMVAWGITRGPDGNMWFADVGRRVGRITMSGVVTLFPVTFADALPGLEGPYWITSGADGNLWYATVGGNSVGRISTSGAFVDYPGVGGLRLTAGADGATWYTIPGLNRITSTGQTSHVADLAQADGVTLGPDGNYWVAGGASIYRVTPSGATTEFPAPWPDSIVRGITPGPDGNIWFTVMGQTQHKIGRLDLHALEPPLCTPDDQTLCLNQGRFKVTASFSKQSESSQTAHAVPLTSDSGYFWFFGASNIEVVVKVLNACTQVPPRYWVFAAGLTNVEVTMTVTDTQTGVQAPPYVNPLGTPFAPIQDTGAFSTCP